MLLKSYSNLLIEIGTDEAGRGCLAGPVTAAAILINDKLENELINDSKKLSIGSRKNLRSFIEEHNNLFSIAQVYENTIDEINILNASIEAMHKAISTLSFEPEFIIVDGNRFKPYKQVPHQTIVKGDSKYLSIAAASILAKTYRDEYMLQLHEEFPMYGWDTNMGYPTKKHRAAIVRYGPCKYHRKTFSLVPEQLVLDLNR